MECLLRSIVFFPPACCQGILHLEPPRWLKAGENFLWERDAEWEKWRKRYLCAVLCRGSVSSRPDEPVLSLEMDWPTSQPQDPTNWCSGLLLNTIPAASSSQPVLFQQQVRLSVWQERDAHTVEATAAPISSLPDRRSKRKFLSSSSRDQAKGGGKHIICVCAAPALLSHPLVNPNHGSLATLQHGATNQHQWAQIFGAAGSSISAPFDLRSRPLPFLSPAHLVSLALGKGRSREIKVQKRKSFQSWHWVPLRRSFHPFWLRPIWQPLGASTRVRNRGTGKPQNNWEQLPIIDAFVYWTRICISWGTWFTNMTDLTFFKCSFSLFPLRLVLACWRQKSPSVVHRH